MKLQDVKCIALALFCAATSSCCGDSDSSSGGSTGTTSSEPPCACDCPDGPTAPSLTPIDDYCASPEHDGAACCRNIDGSEVGVCKRFECWATEQAQ